MRIQDFCNGGGGGISKVLPTSCSGHIGEPRVRIQDFSKGSGGGGGSKVLPTSCSGHVGKHPAPSPLLDSHLLAERPTVRGRQKLAWKKRGYYQVPFVHHIHLACGYHRRKDNYMEIKSNNKSILPNNKIRITYKQVEFTSVDSVGINEWIRHSECNIHIFRRNAHTSCHHATYTSGQLENNFDI